MSLSTDPQRPKTMADQDVLDDDRLRRGRLRGALARGSDWRRRPEKSTARRLLIGAVIGFTVIVVLYAVSFVQVQLRKQAEARQSQTAVATAPATPSASPTEK